MVARFLICLIALAVAITLPSPVYAQKSGGVSSEKAPPSNTKKQLATIVFAGIAGAILGLSTLSFYGRPQEKLSNIAIGFAVGVISGAAYTTYQAATKPRDFYRSESILLEEEAFAREMRFAQGSTPLKLNWSIEF